MLPVNATPSGMDMQSLNVQTTDSDIIVIGAGISGLACAAHLRSAGMRVVVLEARPRLGGRLHTILLDNVPGHPRYAVDLGAAWVHGIGSAAAPNQLYSMARELNLGCRPTDYNDAAVYTAGEGRLAESAVTDIERLYHVFEQHLQSLLHAADPRPALMPIQTALEAFAAAHNLSAAQSEQLSFAVSNHMEHYWAGEVRSMGVAALDEVVLPGGDVVLMEGYGGIVGLLAAGLDVRLRHEVLAIHYQGSGVTVTARVGDCVDQEGGGGNVGGLVKLTARAAVVTLPIGVLRSGAVQFTPPLEAVDPRKAAAIGQLGVAVYNKVVMLYDTADVFWDDTAFIYRIPAAWEAGRWSYFLNLHKVAGIPILVAFNLGESAVQLEGVSDQEVVEGALQALAGMYGTARVRRPRRAMVTRWGSDPHSRMSYTYVPAGLTGAAFDDMARPVRGSLYFAGEATHRRHYGTAHGAYESGRLAASAILTQLAGPSPARKWAMGYLAPSIPAVPLSRRSRTQPRAQSRWRAKQGARVAGTTTSIAANGTAPLYLAPTGGVQSQPPPQQGGAMAVEAEACCSMSLVATAAVDSGQSSQLQDDSRFAVGISSSPPRELSMPEAGAMAVGAPSPTIAAPSGSAIAPTLRSKM